MPMDGDFFKWLISQGVGVALAGMMFLYYRKDMKGYADLWEKQADQQRQQAQALMALVERQVTTNVQLLAAIDALHRRLDDEGFPRAPRSPQQENAR